MYIMCGHKDSALKLPVSSLGDEKTINHFFQNVLKAAKKKLAYQQNGQSSTGCLLSLGIWTCYKEQVKNNLFTVKLQQPR